MVITFTRILQVYIIQGAICVFFLFIGYKIIKRGPKKRLNQIFALFFLIIAASLIVNFIYVPIEDANLQLFVTILNVFTIYFIVLAMGFLLIFILIIEKSEKIINTQKQIIIIIIYAVLLSVLFFIPSGAEVAITPTGQSSPVWNLPFVLYTLSIEGITLFLTIWYSLRILKKFEDRNLAKKWKFFIIGVCIIWYIGIIVPINNYLNDPDIRTIIGLSGIVIVVGAYLIYYGVGKQV